jgi:hypothetical protein
MTIGDLVRAIGALCGLFMVVGGMLLLRSGVITLDRAGSKEAASVEFQKLIKVTTHYPALGLFVIGLAFILIALYNASPSYNISGQIKAAHPEAAKISVSGGPWGGVLPTPTGEVKGTVTPALSQLTVVVRVPGYKDRTIPVEVGLLGRLHIDDKYLIFADDSSGPLSRPSLVKSLPQGVDLPPLSDPGAFR